LNSPKVQRSRQLTGAYLKLRCKLPGNNARVKTPMHLWLYCPVTELYTPVRSVARGIFPDSIGVCALWRAPGDRRRKVPRVTRGERKKRLPRATASICWGRAGGYPLMMGIIAYGRILRRKDPTGRRNLPRVAVRICEPSYGYDEASQLSADRRKDLPAVATFCELSSGSASRRSLPRGVVRIGAPSQPSAGRRRDLRAVATFGEASEGCDEASQLSARRRKDLRAVVTFCKASYGATTSYFRPNFLSCSRSPTASASRFRRVSSFLASSIQRTYSRRYEGARFEKFVHAAPLVRSASSM
jgi:hypothetical protein